MKSQGAADATPARREARTRPSVWRIVATAVALIAVGGVVARSLRHQPAPPQPAKPIAPAHSSHRLVPPRARAAELAFLQPLSPGKPFKDWTVRGISAVFRGSIRVALDRGHDRVQLRVVKAGGGPVAPAQSGPYAVYYSVKHVDRANSADVQVLADALARVAAGNQKLEPPGLTTFRQDPRDGDWQ